ncbi:MAG TPA: hypothetical protein VM327_01085 [Candidatus Thermoplasmatota archaeon]|nr:hypothetical protein [Candidatus Thermoplasmatota archaeon]
MKPAIPWLCFGAAGAFLVAALVSVALRGPAWPYHLMLSAAFLLVAVLTSLRVYTQQHARALSDRDKTAP